MKSKIKLGFALILSATLLGCATAKKTPPAKGGYPLTTAEIKQVDRALQKLKPGMTAAEVVAILDPTPLHFISPQSGGTSGNYLRAVYNLRPGFALILVENMAVNPPKFIGYQKAGDSWLSP